LAALREIPFSIEAAPAIIEFWSLFVFLAIWWFGFSSPGARRTLNTRSPF
jgi:hypothetical protein